MQMVRKELEGFAIKSAECLKTSQNLNDFSRNLKRTTFDAALSAEMSERELNLCTPRDHNGTYKFQ
jgi:transposase-like protein